MTPPNGAGWGRHCCVAALPVSALSGSLIAGTSPTLHTPLSGKRAAPTASVEANASSRKGHPASKGDGGGRREEGGGRKEEGERDMVSYSRV